MSKFRFHWGWAIGVFYSLFVIVMLAIVIKSFTVDNSLVVDNYYQYDIDFQKHADKITNAKGLKKDLEFIHERGEKEFTLVFPEEFNKYTGTIWFYKPDDKKQDVKFKVEPDTSYTQVIDLAKLSNGYWRIKIDWEGDEKEFYKEHSIFN